MFRQDLFKGKRILITGGGTGLGKSMTRRFAELGADCVICGRRKEPLDETAREIKGETGREVITIPCDIRNYANVEAMVDEIWQSAPLTGLVNNAAGNFISRTEDLSPRGFDAIASIVFHGTFYVTHAIGKRWLEQGLKGSVLSILTTWVFTGSPFVTPSAMSKSGVAAMTRGLAVEWGPRGIRLNAVCPGPFPTEGAWARLMPEGSRADADRSMDSIPMRRYGEHSELANLCAFLMADEVAYINGEVMAIDGGQWLNGSGTYARLHDLSDEDWTQIRDRIKSATAQDKLKRTV